MFTMTPKAQIAGWLRAMYIIDTKQIYFPKYLLDLR